jgi:Mrp family chromosome partitioning ATPase
VVAGVPPRRYSDSVCVIEMLNRMNVDMIGVVENMAYYRVPFVVSRSQLQESLVIMKLSQHLYDAYDQFITVRPTN